MRFGQVITSKRSKGILTLKSLFKKKKENKRRKSVWSKIVSFLRLN
jgi:hypothetical protein